MKAKKMDELETESEEIMLLVSVKLNELIQKKRIETRDLVNATGISTTLINMLRRGEGNPTAATILKLARFFGKPITYFLEQEPHETNNNAKIIHLKVYSSLVKNIAKEDELYIITIKKDRYPNASFAFKIETDDMLPMFRKETIFLVSESQKPKNGDTVLLKTNNGYIIRRVHIMDDKTVFSTLDIHATFEDLSSQIIAGTIIGIISG